MKVYSILKLLNLPQSIILLGAVLSILLLTSFTIQIKAFGETTPSPPDITINDIAMTEGNSGSKSFVFTVTRSGNVSDTSSFAYETADGSANLENSDYVAIPLTTLNFTAGETTKTVTVVVNSDIELEGDETFFVNLSNCVGCSISDSQGVGTILNDDTAPVTVSINDVSMPEGNSGSKSFVFTVTRSGGTSGASSVNYATADGSAKSASDYAAIPLTTLNFTAGETTKTVTILVNGDTTTEPNEAFSVNLSSCVSCTISDGQGVGIIQNDDTAPPASTISINDMSLSEGNSGTKGFVFTVTRTGSTSGTSSVNYATSAGSAMSPGDFTANSGTVSFAAGEITKTVTIVVKGDTTVEPNETFSVNLSNCINCTIGDGQGVGTVQNDDTAPVTVSINDVSLTEGNSGSKSFVFTVTRSGSTSGTLSVKYATANGAATSPSDYAAIPLSTLSFASGETTKTVTVVVKGDSAVEPNEAFYANLSNCAGCSISDSQGVGTIQNDDTAPATISINDMSLSEGNSGTKGFVFTVTRTGSTSGTSSVNYATSAGTATTPGDFTAKSGKVNFATNDVTETFTVLVNGDTTVEPNETFTVNLSSCVSCTISDSKGVGTIKNDDTAPATISIIDVSMPEGNSGSKSFVFTVTRSGGTSGASSVNYATADGSATSPSDYGPILLSTFDFSAGETTKKVTVLVHGDSSFEPNETFSVNLSNCVGCIISDSQGVGTVQNDDTAPATISINDMSLSEGNSGTKGFVFTLTRSSGISGTSSVNYATADGSASVADSDYLSNFGSVAFAAGETTKTVTILVKGDTTVEPNEAFSVNLSNCVGCTLSDSQAVGIIQSEDTAPVIISINDVSMPEGNSGSKSFVFTVTRSGDTKGASSVDYATTSATATSSVDYITTSLSTVKFASNEAKKTVTIIVKGDSAVEPNETFHVNLLNCASCTISDSKGVGTIQNDDLPSADSDADGVPDATDRCPNQRGSQANNGCPAPTSVAGGGQGNDLSSFFASGGFVEPSWMLSIILAVAATAAAMYFRGKISLKFVKRYLPD